MNAGVGLILCDMKFAFHANILIDIFFDLVFLFKLYSLNITKKILFINKLDDDKKSIGFCLGAT